MNELSRLHRYHVHQASGGWGGSKGGEMHIDQPSQHVLPRTAVIVSSSHIEVRFTVSLPGWLLALSLGRDWVNRFIHIFFLFPSASTSTRSFDYGTVGSNHSHGEHTTCDSQHHVLRHDGCQTSISSCSLGGGSRSSQVGRHLLYSLLCTPSSFSCSAFKHSVMHVKTKAQICLPFGLRP